jgi:RNA polymerase sigma-70 factor (ECF subfamily)
MQVTEPHFLQAYEEYADAIFRYCLFRVYDRELARDLTQETFMRAWRRQSEGEHIKNIRAFLYTVARNLIIDHSRRARPQSLDVMMEQGGDVGVDGREQTVDKIDVSLVLDVLEGCDEQSRDVVILRYVEGWRVKDIAKELGISQTAASVRLHRALRMLRKQLSV